MNDRDLLYFKKRLDLIDWNGDFAKADKGNYEVLDKLCEYIEIALNVKQNSKIVEKALLILAWKCGVCRGFWEVWRKFCKPSFKRRFAYERTGGVILS